MRQKKGFVLREVCGEKVIVGEGLEAINFGHLVGMNETAEWLWKKAGELGEFTAAELADALCQEYDVDKARALNDVQTLLKSWQEMKIVEG